MCPCPRALHAAQGAGRHEAEVGNFGAYHYQYHYQYYYDYHAYHYYYHYY